ncbi:MAG: hypothetical protein ABI954_06180 [Pyrinomonadaceae bacterium]
MRNIFLIIFLVCGAAGSSLAIKAQETKTVINDKAAKTKLLGRHLFSLQWIGWDYFGNATVVERHGVLHVTGKQKSRKDADFVTIDGWITEIDKFQFKFDGKIVTTVSFINDGKECVREGEMTFKITGKRKYWRLQEMLNPCTNIETDYVDIYFR